MIQEYLLDLCRKFTLRALISNSYVTIFPSLVHEIRK